MDGFVPLENVRLVFTLIQVFEKFGSYEQEQTVQYLYFRHIFLDIGSIII